MRHDADAAGLPIGSHATTTQEYNLRQHKARAARHAPLSFEERAWLPVELLHAFPWTSQMRHEHMGAMAGGHLPRLMPSADSCWSQPHCWYTPAPASTLTMATASTLQGGGRTSCLGRVHDGAQSRACRRARTQLGPSRPARVQKHVWRANLRDIAAKVILRGCSLVAVETPFESAVAFESNAGCQTTFPRKRGPMRLPSKPSWKTRR